MFKSALWRSEKTKFKVEFKLQFRATKVPDVGDNALMISVVPADSGKPTVKSDRASVRDGNCLWENPIYETVKFNRDPKSRKIHERVYYFVVGTGLSKAGLIGEASIDFSNYAEATKVSLVSLPLVNSKTEAVLHVSIQRIQESSMRWTEETVGANLDYKDHSLKAHLDIGEINGVMRSNSEDMTLNHEVSQIAEVIGDRRASGGSDVTMSSSESISGVEIPWQPQLQNDGVHDQAAELLSTQRPQVLKTNVQTPVYKENQRSNWEWLGSSATEASTDDSSSTPSETSPRQHLEETSDMVIEKLKSDFAALSRQAEMAEVELQTLRKQIVKESKKGQDLLRELVSLKEERDVLKGECERLRALQRRVDDTNNRASLQSESRDSKAIIEELRQELSYAKELNANLRLQLQKTQESNSELLLAVQDLDEMLEEKNKEILSLSSGSPEKHMAEMVPEKGSTHLSDNDEEQQALEELVKEPGETKDAYLWEQQIIDMRSEIEIYKRDRDELEMQMEQLALDYEILKQENHEMTYKLGQSELQAQLKLQYECSPSYLAAHELESQVENLENELKTRSKEAAEAVVKISVLKAHVCSLDEELEKQSKDAAQKLESQGKDLGNELKAKSKEFAEALIKISELEAHVCSLEEELEKQSKEAAHKLDSQGKDLGNELKAKSKEFAEALIKISELEARVCSLEEELEKQSKEAARILESEVENLENELKTRSRESAEALLKISELEAHVCSLQEELERQSKGFEADLDALMLSKVEQEQRAIRAEETLRKTQRHNASTAERIQEEFKRLSVQMTSTFTANEKLASKAMAEASNLRLHKRLLEETIQKAYEEHQSVKDSYEARLDQFASQVKLMSHQIEMMQSEIEDKVMQLENQRKLAEETQNVLSSEISTLEDELEVYKVKNKISSEEMKGKDALIHQLEEMRTSFKQMELLLEQGNNKQVELENKITLAKSEAKELQENLNKMRCLVEEKELLAGNLKSELDSLQAQFTELKKCIADDEVEKDKLRRQVFILESDLKEKEGAIDHMENMIKDGNDRGTTPGSEEVAILKETIKLLEDQIKLKESDLKTSSSTFLEKEKDLLNKIEELEGRLGALCQSSNSDENDDDKIRDTRNLSENLSDRSKPSNVNGCISLSRESHDSNAMHETQRLDELKSQVALLKERNESMETELREMQGRYSEISLKFAEVEGERQQLVMKVRNLKNAKKRS